MTEGGRPMTVPFRSPVSFTPFSFLLFVVRCQWFVAIAYNEELSTHTTVETIHFSNCRPG